MSPQYNLEEKMRNVWVVILCLGCPTEPTDTKDTGDVDADADADADSDTDTDADTDNEINASGDWAGTCNYIPTGYTSVDFVGMDLSLTDNAGAVTGTMIFTSYYTGTTSSYSGQYNLDGTRTDDQLLLTLSSTTTTTTSGSTATVSLTIDGDTMAGTFNQYGAPQLDCEFTR